MPAKRPTLRTLATTAGLFKGTDLNTMFRMPSEDILVILEKKFPGVSDLDEDQVLKLIAKVKEDGAGSDAKEEEEKPARGGRRGSAREEEEPAPARGGRRSKVEEPAEESKEEKPARGRRGKTEEPAEEPKEEEKPARGRRGKVEEPAEPAKDEEPARGGRARRGARREEEPEPPATQAAAGNELDVKILAMVEGISARLEALEGVVNANAKALTTIIEELELIGPMIEQARAGIDAVTFDLEIPKKIDTLAALAKHLQD